MPSDKPIEEIHESAIWLANKIVAHYPVSMLPTRYNEFILSEALLEAKKVIEFYSDRTNWDFVESVEPMMLPEMKIHSDEGDAGRAWLAKNGMSQYGE